LFQSALFETRNLCQQNSQFYVTNQEKYLHFNKIYSDASKSAQGVGFAVTQNNISIRLTNVYKYIKDAGRVGVKVVVVGDEGGYDSSGLLERGVV